MMKIEKIGELNFSNYGTRASVDIKIGNLETNIDINKKSGDKEVVISKNRDLDFLENTIGELDYNFLIEEYKEKLEKIDEVREEQRRKDAAKRWDEFWGNKVKFNHPKVSLKIQPREDYIENRSKMMGYREPDIYMVYRDKKINVVYQDVGRNSYGRSKNMKYVISNEITGYRKRNYSSLEKTANKIVELVDEWYDNKRIQREIEARDKNKKQKKLAKFKELFGEVIIIKEFYRPFNGGGHMTDNFYIVRGEYKYSIEETDEEGLYHFAGLKKLSSDQINKILDIIREV